MIDEYWESSPFGKDSIFNPSFDEKQRDEKEKRFQGGEIIDISISSGDLIREEYFRNNKSDRLGKENAIQPIKNISQIQSNLSSVTVSISVYTKGYSESVYVTVNKNKQRAVNLGSIFVAVFKLNIPKKEGKKKFEITAQITDFSGDKSIDAKKMTATIDSDGKINKSLIIENNVSFEELVKAGELNTDEIKKYREFIKDLPHDEKKIWYFELQKHTAYHSQRDNNNPKAEVMCNLTSLAMNLEFLGVACPDNNMQFEDWLEQKRVDKKYPDRTDPNCWIKLANDLGVKSDKIDIWSKKSNTEEEIKKIVFDKIEPYISNGHSISVSAFTIASTKGHIVRLQSINNDGIVVDDPYGRVNNFKQREEGGSGYKGSLNSKDNIDIFGKDNLWRWNDIKICTIKYIVVFYKLEK
jgi:hypothetical protein